MTFDELKREEEEGLRLAFTSCKKGDQEKVTYNESPQEDITPDEKTHCKISMKIGAKM